MKNPTLEQPSIIDCILLKAGEGGEDDDRLLAMAHRTGRHPIRLIEHESAMAWSCSDGRIEVLGIDPTHEDASLVRQEIATRGLLVAEFLNTSEVQTAIPRCYWLLGGPESGELLSGAAHE